MAALSLPIACESSCARHATHEELLTSRPSQGAPSNEKFHHVELTASSVYSLTYGTLPSASNGTSTSHLLLGSASSTSSFSPAHSLQMSDDPPIHPSERMSSLLSKLARGITTLQMAFSVMRASSAPLNPAESSFVGAEKAMFSELRTLSDLQTRLYSLILQHGFCPKDEHLSKASASQRVGTDAERKDAMLRAYEGIITRFHDAIGQKDATVEALKQTLAKSMLKGEKLERRIKALETKLFSELKILANHCIAFRRSDHL